MNGFRGRTSESPVYAPSASLHTGTFQERVQSGYPKRVDEALENGREVIFKWQNLKYSVLILGSLSTKFSL
jgi:hypothetical protein